MWRYVRTLHGQSYTVQCYHSQDGVVEPFVINQRLTHNSQPANKDNMRFHIQQPNAEHLSNKLEE